MSPRHEELIAGYLDAALSEAEREELLGALRSDPDVVRALAEALEIHRALQFAALSGAESADRAADRILQFVRASQDGTGFFERVKARALASAEPARPRHRAVYPGRRRRGVGPPSRALPIGVAAALFLGLLLAATLSRPPRTRTGAKSVAEGRAPEPSPEVARDEAARLERERREAERRLETIEQDRKRLAEDRRKAEDARQEELRKRAEEAFARTQAEFEEAQKRLAQARESERRAKESLARAEPGGRPDPPKRDTQAAPFRASLERAEGPVFVLAGSRREPARAGRLLVAGEGLETGGASGRAVVRFEDGTVIDLGPAGMVRGMSDHGGREGVGRHIELSRGVLKAEVEARPPGQALVIATPHGEARVLGTALRVVVESGGTRLEVTSGRVRLTRHADGQGVDVPSGHFAVAAAGVELASWRIPAEEVTINFGAAATPLPEGVWNDSGEEFDPRRGYGWKGPRGAREVPGTYYVVEQATGRRFPFMPGVGRPMPAGCSYDTDPVTGKPKLFRADRGAGFNARQLANVGPLRASGLALGWINHTETWSMPVPNGRYLVTVCVGSADYEHGPHHVAVEGRQVINKVLTKAGQFFEAKDAPIEVKDGELTLVVGGFGTGAVSSDGSSDTILNYLVLKKVNGK
jgi:ferric-dicitrate binding protein FerR (iron transport regulator)